MAGLEMACLATPGGGECQALVLARSVRALGGALAGIPLRALVPGGPDCLSGPIRAGLEALDVRLEAFAIDPALAGFPFAGKVHAAAAAEATAREACLAWLDSDSLILNPPWALRLAEGQTLACRPVDLALIGSPDDAPPDAFWQAVYTACAVPPARIFPVTTSADRKRLRAYFNAGLLVVRPEAGLLRAWREAFARLALTPAFTPFYDQHALYRVFFHQAVLAGVILARLDRSQIAFLPDGVNYPLHLHARYPSERRAARLNDLVSARYDTFFDDPGWREAIPTDEPLRGWLEAQARLLGGESPLIAPD